MRVKINESEYSRVQSLWVRHVFKRLVSNIDIYNKFEKALGIESSSKSIEIYHVFDEKKFFLNVLKYGINYENLKNL